MLPASLPPPLAPVSHCPAMLNMCILTFPAMANIVYLKMNFFGVIYIVLELICKAMS